MLVVQDAFNASDLPRGGIATIGNYDGIHRGQQAVLDRVLSRAGEAGLQSMVITFDPHPLAVLRPDTQPPRLTTAAQKAALLEERGIDVLLVVDFTRGFARTPARRFVEEFLLSGLDVREIYVGSRFTFGRGREGDFQLLQEMGEQQGFEAVAVEEVLHSGEPISSTRVRRALGEGNVEMAAELLGRPYSIGGVIVRGDCMGQRLGWPTINLDPKNELIPADGVYATRVYFPGFSATFDSATNIGSRPTVYENYQRVVESHILDFSSDVYGETVELAFFKRLREEQMFPSTMDLSAQIGRDVEASREYFRVRNRLQNNLAANATTESEPLP